ncbi:cardiolipin synthase ClsB [Hydrogenophaga sp.]|uniref:cardiolipin synthase ClsB n=1 Tax=Hydrogenophaga sp. TaxID=1904254 RepID=UPI002731F065|nr:cardiolipin synthase ClsB [Hydrogenophaga sp.]MDP2074079.1 cardiolipin synthase ClsB [Hydrogenophaga sp.]MDP3109450.1 cardiolipin synthase ClsB [Hydrogenophaga sp.]
MNSHWVPGNHFKLLENGEGYYPRVFEVIAAAEREVLLETFILFDDKVGRQLQQALLAAAGRGAEVHVLIDGWGSPDLPESFTQPLLDAGVRLRSFEPVQRLFGARINLLRRMHNKLVVVDGERAFVGGINYSEDHLTESHPQGKQDYAVEVEGPLVGQIQAFCRANVLAPQPTRGQWIQRWRADLEDDSSQGAEDNGAVAAFVTRDNHLHRTDIERHYRAAVRSAQRRVLIANAYFFPGYRLLRDLRRAARRGVQVDLVLQGHPDQPWVKRATELLYRHLLRAGVNIFEYNERPLHGKVAVVDDTWATVGSSNLDPTSLSLNLEANVVVRDVEFARQLRERIDHLMAESCERVERQATGRLHSFWIALRSMVVFHALRRFPVWASKVSVREPRVVPMHSEAP